MNWFKKFLTHYVLYGVLLLVLCLGIFPFIVLYSSSVSIAELLDRFSAGRNSRRDSTASGPSSATPYDYLVNGRLTGRFALART